MPKDVDEIALAPLRQSDSDILFSWINDRDLVIASAPFRPVTRAEHDAWFVSVPQRRDSVAFGVRLLKDDRLIGLCQLVDISPIHRSAELRIRIGDPDTRGKGYGTRAVEKLIMFGFRDLGLNRIHLHVFDDNHAARRVYLKVGFVDEGLLRQAAFIDNRYKSLHVMAILREEYDRRHPPA